VIRAGSRFDGIAVFLTVLFGAMSTFGGSASAATIGPYDPTVSVSVMGQAISYADIRALELGILSKPQLNVEHARGPSEMPNDDPLVTYIGTSAADVSTVRVSKACDDAPSGAAAQPCDDAYTAAFALLALDRGKCGPVWQGVYERTAADRGSRLQLGHAIADAFRMAGDQAAADAAAKASWIRAQAVLGTKRADFYDLLRSKGYVAFNGAYVKGKPSSGSGRYALPGCSFPDGVGGEWPYQNEPIPIQEGGCKFGDTKAPQRIRNPNASVEFYGGFNLGCGSITTVTVSFGEDDRVTKAIASKPVWSCI
jgi:hypothetical protein